MLTFRLRTFWTPRWWMNGVFQYDREVRGQVQSTMQRNGDNGDSYCAANLNWASLQMLFLCLCTVSGNCWAFLDFFVFHPVLKNTNFTGRGYRKIHGIRSSFDPRVSVCARVCGPGWPVRSQMHRGLRFSACQCAVNTRVVRDESGRGGQRQCPLLRVPSDHLFIYLMDPALFPLHSFSASI